MPSGKTEAAKIAIRDAGDEALPELKRYISDRSAGKHKWSIYKTPVNQVHGVITLGLTAPAVLSLILDCSLMAKVATGLTNGYVAVLLVIVTIHSDGARHWYELLPHRVTALAMAFLLIVDSQGKPGKEALDSVLADPGNAVYFSVVTITTLGDGDYSPMPSARCLVIWELASGFLLLLLLVPLVISESPEDTDGAPLPRDSCPPQTRAASFKCLYPTRRSAFHLVLPGPL